MDANLLRISGVSMDLLRFSNFASYILVLNIVSYRTVDKISVLVDAR